MRLILILGFLAGLIGAAAVTVVTSRQMFREETGKFMIFCTTLADGSVIGGTMIINDRTGLFKIMPEAGNEVINGRTQKCLVIEMKE